jgi:hypothetical protein
MLLEKLEEAINEELQKSRPNYHLIDKMITNSKIVKDPSASQQAKIAALKELKRITGTAEPTRSKKKQPAIQPIETKTINQAKLQNKIKEPEQKELSFTPPEPKQMELDFNTSNKEPSQLELPLESTSASKPIKNSPPPSSTPTAQKGLPYNPHFNKHYGVSEKLWNSKPELHQELYDFHNKVMSGAMPDLIHIKKDIESNKKT